MPPDAEELLEHTRMAMYQDRIFAFTPKGELIQLPKGATPVDFAYAVHTDLGDQTVGAKINGRRDAAADAARERRSGRNHQVLQGAASAADLARASSSPARRAPRSAAAVRTKEREETVALGRKMFDEIVERLPAPLGWEAMAEALRRLELPDDEALMEAIARQAGRRRRRDGGADAGLDHRRRARAAAAARRDLDQGADAGRRFRARRMLPPDTRRPHRRPAARRRGHRGPYDRLPDSLANGIDADWVDLAWGDETDGGTARLAIVIRNQPGSLAVIAGILGSHGANIVSMDQTARDGSFHTFHLDVEVHDLPHLMRILAALRATEVVSTAERL